MSESFNWHHYISVSPKFSPIQTSLMNSALDQISAAHDDEGKLLIQSGARHQRGKFTLVPAAHNYLDEAKHELGISFEDAGHIVFKENGVSRRPSLNGILAHELVHAADNYPTPEQFDKIVNVQFPHLLRTNGVSEKDIAKTTQQLHAIGKHISRRYVIKLLVEDGLGRVITNQDLQASGRIELAAALKAVSLESTQKMLQEAGEIDKAGTPSWEKRAVDYADYFMHKNHGNAEPQRGNFNNGQIVSTFVMPNVLNVDKNAHYNSNEVPQYCYAEEPSTLSHLKEVATRIGHMMNASSIRHSSSDETYISDSHPRKIAANILQR